MKKSKTGDKSRVKEQTDRDDIEDLDRFIEKREIQNEALKKIVNMDSKISNQKIDR